MKNKGKAAGSSRSSRPGVPWTDVVAGWIKGFRFLVWEAFLGLFSRKHSVQSMSIIFLGSLLGIASVFLIAGYWYWEAGRSGRRGPSQSELAARHLGAFIEKQASGAKKKFSVFDMGEFIVEMKRPSYHKDVKGVLNMAELQIMVECDTKETCNYIENNVQKARDQCTNVLIAFEREELLSREGKKRILKLLQERINLWLPKGKVDGLYFTKLVIS